MRTTISHAEMSDQTNITERELRQAYRLPPGMKFEPLHRICPRCGLDLTQQMPEAEDDQRETKQIESQANYARPARVSGNFEIDSNLLLQRMVAPLTEAEKERAQRNEQRWLDGQVGQQPGSGNNEHGEPSSHQHFVPMVERKFFKWITHAWKFITRSTY